MDNFFGRCIPLSYSQKALLNLKSFPTLGGVYLWEFYIEAAALQSIQPSINITNAVVGCMVKDSILYYI